MELGLYAGLSARAHCRHGALWRGRRRETMTQTTCVRGLTVREPPWSRKAAASRDLFGG
jgi:hypothetical protein